MPTRAKPATSLAKKMEQEGTEKTEFGQLLRFICGLLLKFKEGRDPCGARQGVKQLNREGREVHNEHQLDVAWSGKEAARLSNRSDLISAAKL
jgi:hypothetical protein